ncbi:hypothetical protein COP2_003993 [Malus domestica]
MGKYMKKSKISGDVAVMEVSISPQSSLGVRTRAKTLALQKLQQQQQQKQENQDQSPSGESDSDSSSLYYLQLRSRRLEKPPLRNDAVKKQSQSGGINEPSEKPGGGCCGESRRGPVDSRPKSRLSVGSSVELDWAGPVERKEKEGEEGCFGNFGSGAEYGNDLGVEASFGENNLDFEARDRSTRETTPCSFIRESDTIGTPGSTTRRTSSISTHRRVRNNVQRNIPTTLEMEEFFARHEEEQQKIFIEKYNFDIINDLPLPGRYEWEQVIP